MDVPAADLMPPDKVEARAHRLFVEARARWRKETNSAEAAWQFGRAIVTLAELATNETHRAALARDGIDVCRRAIALDPKSAGAHYYLGLNLGQLAQTKLLGALKLLDQIEESWKTTIALDPKFDYAGGHRTLGILYREAPGWPTGFGSRTKARQHLLKAVELRPDYPGNKLALYESYAKWGEKKLVQDQASATEDYLRAARTRWTGEEWDLHWQEWTKRWQNIKARCAVVTARSPRETR